MNDLRRTPLHDAHVALGARMVPFAGFEMPVSYSGILEEHRAVRRCAGLFDVSDMGEFVVSGPDTWAFLDRLVTNHCARLADDGVLYTVMCREDGTTVDDLLVMRLGPEHALLVVNAANVEKDLAHVKALCEGDVRVENASDAYALIAVQGPVSRDVLAACPTFVPARAALERVPYYRWFRFADSGGGEILVSRTGYTGELGFEVFVEPERAPSLWAEILEHGREFGLLPAGLAARDTLRFEACFPLFGHELDDETTPLEAGLRWVVKFRKGDFVGREALMALRDQGLPRRLVGLELEGRAIARQGFEVERDDAVVGRVTSGTFAPTLEKSLALAYVDREALEGGDVFAVRVRGRDVPARRVGTPFYPSRAAAG